jgi:hypothetical protein
MKPIAYICLIYITVLAIYFFAAWKENEVRQFFIGCFWAHVLIAWLMAGIILIDKFVK